jgi:hypothetical protein
MPDKKITQIDFIESLWYHDLEVNDDLKEYVSKIKLTKIDHVKTNFYQQEQDEKLNELILKQVEPFFKEVGTKLKKTGMSVLKVWIQQYEENNYHPVHVHEPHHDSFSFIFYLNCTETSACTVFYSPGYPYVDHTTFKLEPKVGRCVLFPGALPHEAMPNTDKERLIVSGNIRFH